MPLILVRNDITKMQVDAIVNPTNSRMEPGGGVDAAVHKAAGDALRQACKPLGMLQPGHAVVTAGFSLPCKYIIHTVGPRWYDGWHSEETVLRRCYREALRLAKSRKLESIAFPLISAGSLGFPRERVMPIAVEEIRSFLDKNDMRIYLVVYDRESYALSREHFPEVQAFIEEADLENSFRNQAARFEPRFEALPDMECRSAAMPAPMAAPRRSAERRMASAQPMLDLEQMMAQLDESFSQMLFRKIDEKGLTDAQCYKKANIDRKLFSKIRSPGYKPSKPTVIALGIALELNMEELQDMLQKAGFALSRSNRFDVIIEYCVRSHIYDIFRINEILFSFDQSLLGNV